VPEAGRVITGSAGGLRLDAPGPGTRPLSDRVKQALFSLLEAERPDVWACAFLDLFAGSGAAGIEALSRGAPRAVLVERDGRAAAIVERNLERTGLAARGRIVRRDVAAFLAGPSAGVVEAPFGCVFADPPYAQVGDLLTSLEHLAAPHSGWLDGAALVVAKHFWKGPPPDHVGGLARIRERRFGETALSVYRRASETAAGES
jgi:16S rRNA (guanine(966)-N(2))-methyltransferase RsmD